jgi:hypothetical protein
MKQHSHAAGSYLLVGGLMITHDDFRLIPNLTGCIAPIADHCRTADTCASDSDSLYSFDPAAALTVHALLHCCCLLLHLAGTCASGGGSPYYFDAAAAPLDDAENLLWFHNYTVPANGSVRGIGANDGIVSTLPAQQGIRSVMLVNTKTGGKFDFLQ